MQQGLSRRVLIGIAALVVGLTGLAATLRAASADATITQGSPQLLAGGLSGAEIDDFAVARDGTGALVYTATSGGISHAYLSRLLGGNFSTPQQLDSDGSTQVAVTADNGGQLLVAFASGGNVYAEETTSASQGLSAPQLIATGASNPSISMNLYGVGYLAYTATDGAGDDVDVDYWNGSSWAPASPLAMNATPGDVAGTGTDAPSVAAASDGVGVVAWGEGGHVYARRVWGTATSVETEQLDPASYGGLTEDSATSPEVAVGGDSTYPDIVFAETYQNGSSTVTRAMLTRLVAEDTEPAVAVDGIGAGSDSLAPQVAMGEVGRGLIAADSGTAAAGATTGAASSTPSGQTVAAPYNLEATVLGTNGAPGTPASQDGTDATNPEATPAVFGQVTSALAWDADSGGLSQVVLSYAADGVDLATPLTISAATDGPVQAQDGLQLAGDSRGDGAVAWVQGTLSGTLAIYTEQLYTPESRPTLDPNVVNAATSEPTLNWEASTEDWGSVLYTLLLNGTPVLNTTSTSEQLAGITDGTYSWQLVATNAVGNQVPSNTGKLVVDTFAPRLRLRLTGSPRVRVAQHLSLADTDPPNPTEPGATASGIQTVTVNWGDGSKTQSGAKLTRATHTYTKVGLYTLTVTASDKVGNTTTLTRLIRVL